MNTTQKFKYGFHFTRHEKIAFILVVVFYLTGMAGLLIPQTFHFFKGLIPFALLISTVLLVLFHDGKRHSRTIFFLLFVFLAGFFIEVAGVKTGAIFGEYRYGQSLGLKVFEVPLIIGLNWAMLTYLTSSVTERLSLPLPVKIPIAALLMVIYDLVLEHAAPELDMWHWSGQEVPIRNYVSWFIISLIFQMTGKIFRLESRNRMSAVLLIVQFLLFLILVIFGPNTTHG